MSQYIGAMTVLWVEVPDRAGPDSDRAFIERNAIALLSSTGRQVDPPSEKWLGNFSATPAIQTTGLWNVDYTGYQYDSRLMEVFASYVAIMAGEGPCPEISIAPKDWFLADKGTIGRGQMFLFRED